MGKPDKSDNADGPRAEKKALDLRVGKFLGERLREARTFLKLTQEDLAKECKLAEMTVNRYEVGSRIPDATFLTILAELYNISPNWLLFGLGEMLLTREQAVEVSTEIDDSKIVSLPVFEFGDSSSPQRLMSGEPIETLLVPSTLQEKDSTVVGIYHQNNMTPTINPGAYVGICTKNVSPRSGFVYAVWNDSDGVMLMRVFSSPGYLVFQSDNKQFPDIKVPVSEVKEKSLILGRVEFVFQQC